MEFKQTFLNKKKPLSKDFTFLIHVKSSYTRTYVYIHIYILISFESWMKSSPRSLHDDFFLLRILSILLYSAILNKKKRCWMGKWGKWKKGVKKNTENKKKDKKEEKKYEV